MHNKCVKNHSFIGLLKLNNKKKINIRNPINYIVQLVNDILKLEN